MTCNGSTAPSPGNRWAARLVASGSGHSGPSSGRSGGIGTTTAFWWSEIDSRFPRLPQGLQPGRHAPMPGRQTCPGHLPRLQPQRLARLRPVRPLPLQAGGVDAEVPREGRMSRYIPRGRPATEAEKALAEAALRELDECRLEVGLAPAPDQRHEGHQIRVVSNRNPPWYQEFFATRPPRCWVKRARVVRALGRVAGGYVRRRVAGPVEERRPKPSNRGGTGPSCLSSVLTHPQHP